MVTPKLGVLLAVIEAKNCFDSPFNEPSHDLNHTPNFGVMIVQSLGVFSSEPFCQTVARPDSEALPCK
jgi:hypothetical protein